MANQPKRSEYLGLAELVKEFRNQPEISQLTGSASILHTKLYRNKLGVRSVPERCATLRSVWQLNDLFFRGVSMVAVVF